MNRYILTSSQQLVILILVAVGLNINTLFNSYAVDDVVVLTENTLVQKGISGIPEILTTDLFAGFRKTGDGLSEARYRPVALVIFALEYQFFGANPFVSHLINILFFAILIFLLFKLLNTYVFRKEAKCLTFITCLIFVVHPIHTEVIANVKSRDELIVFILLVISLIAIIRYAEKRVKVALSISLFCYFLALLTRESAVALIGVVPLVLYFFFDKTIKQSFFYAFPLVVVLVCYLILRFSITGFNGSSSLDLLNSPFLYASAGQAFATKIFILLKYIFLLVYPNPLSCDYGFNQIPYIEIISKEFILSVIILLSLLSYSVITFRKKSLFTFSIIYYFITIALASNFVVDIGTPLSERLLFQPSLAFCIVIAAFYFKIEKRFQVVTNVFLTILVFLFSLKTILRNSEWKNDETLYFSDVISSPNSARTNLYASQCYLLKAKVELKNELKNEYLNKAIYYGERSVAIYPNYPITYLNLGVAYFGLLDYFKTAELWLKAYELNPADTEAKESVDMLSEIFLKEGVKLFKSGYVENSIKCYIKSVELNAGNVEAWYNLGGSYFFINDEVRAIDAWKNVFKLDSKHVFNKEHFY